MKYYISKHGCDTCDTNAGVGMEPWQRRFFEELQRVKEYQQALHTTSIPESTDPGAGCLHSQCPTCHGTFQGPYGACVHGISCPCPMCSPRC